MNLQERTFMNTWRMELNIFKLQQKFLTSDNDNNNDNDNDNTTNDNFNNDSNENNTNNN